VNNISNQLKLTTCLKGWKYQSNMDFIVVASFISLEKADGIISKHRMIDANTSSGNRDPFK